MIRMVAGRWAALLVAVLAVVGLLVAPGSAAASATAFDVIKSNAGGGRGSIVSPANGELWATTASSGGVALDHYVDGSFVGTTTLAGADGGSLYASGSDDVWLVSNSSARHFNGTSWQTVTYPTGPGGETLYPQTAADAPGPDFYVAFQYFGVDGDAYDKTVARWDGATWTLLGEPAGDYTFEQFEQMEYTTPTAGSPSTSSPTSTDSGPPRSRPAATSAAPFSSGRMTGS